MRLLLDRRLQLGFLGSLGGESNLAHERLVQSVAGAKLNARTAHGLAHVRRNGL
jgi:hypothetical protein